MRYRPRLGPDERPELLDPYQMELVVEALPGTEPDVERVRELVDDVLEIRSSSFVPREQLQEWRLRAAESLDREIPDLSRFYRILLAARGELRPDWERAAAAATRINESEIGFHATVAARPSLPRIHPSTRVTGTGDESSRQGYLDATGARFAWFQAGGSGQEVRVCDCEMGFDATHEELGYDVANGTGSVVKVVSSLGGVLTTRKDHGVSTLGVLGAINNGWGLRGICHESELLFASEAKNFRSQCITEAIGHLCRGDVLLLEMQGAAGGTRFEVPAEFEPDVCSAVLTAAGLGIVVVQAAGNAGADLASVKASDGKVLWDVDRDDYFDSLAVIVGSGHPKTQESCMLSNFGKRVDCQGWGERVWTCHETVAGNHRLFYGNFNSTSSAAAIVTGAVACLQGRAKEKLKRPLTPLEVRSFLSKPANGKPQPCADAAKKPIGPLPDLEKIFCNEGLI